MVGWSLEDETGATVATPDGGFEEVVVFAAAFTLTAAAKCLLYSVEETLGDQGLMVSGVLHPAVGRDAEVGPDPRKVDTSGVSYAAWVSVADVSASKSLGARKLHQECCLRVL